MKKGKNHLGFIMTVLGVMVAFISALSIFGFVVERDIVSISSDRPEVFVGQPGGQVAGVAIEQTTVVIDRGQGNTLSVVVPIYDSSTAFDVLQSATAVSGLELQTQQFDTGILVEGIGGMISGQDNQYWLYYVNGASTANSVDRQPVVAGDSIEFKFEEVSL